MLGLWWADLVARMGETGIAYRSCTDLLENANLKEGEWRWEDNIMKELAEDHVLWWALVLGSWHLQVTARISIVVIVLDHQPYRTLQMGCACGRVGQENKGVLKLNWKQLFFFFFFKL
jgi:hypothetical protein